MRTARFTSRLRALCSSVQVIRLGVNSFRRAQVRGLRRKGMALGSPLGFRPPSNRTDVAQKTGFHYSIQGGYIHIGNKMRS
jgi:hypothetical protein